MTENDKNEEGITNNRRIKKVKRVKQGTLRNMLVDVNSIALSPIYDSVRWGVQVGEGIYPAP